MMHSKGSGTPLPYKSFIRAVALLSVLPIFISPGIAGFLSAYTMLVIRFSVLVLTSDPNYRSAPA